MKHPQLHLKVKRSASGLGLFAMQPIPKGTRVIEYTGEKITVEEGNIRKGMYLFALNSKWLGKRIFVVFQTLKERDTVESSGVGLAIVKKILDRKKQTIQVSSQPGIGSVFSFTWPKN